MGSPFPDMHPEIKLGMHPKKMRYTSVAKDRGMEYGVWSMDDHDRPTGGTSGRGPNAARIALAAKRPQPRSRAGCLGVDRAATCGDVPWTRAPPSALHCPRVGAPPPPSVSIMLAARVAKPSAPPAKCAVAACPNAHRARALPMAAERRKMPVLASKRRVVRVQAAVGDVEEALQPALAALSSRVRENPS